MTGRPALQDALAALRARFVAGLARDEARIAEAAAAMAPACSDATAEAVRRLAHRLAGAGGTFGFPELSRAASDLEAAACPGGEAVAVAAAVGRLLDEIGRVRHEAGQGGG